MTMVTVEVVTRDYDAILASVGELGLWHWLVLLSLIPPALLPGMWSVLFVFSGYVVRCTVIFLLPHLCNIIRFFLDLSQMLVFSIKQSTPNSYISDTDAASLTVTRRLEVSMRRRGSTTPPPGRTRTGPRVRCTAGGT